MRRLIVTKADQVLPQAAGFAESVMHGDAALAGCGDELFAS